MNTAVLILIHQPVPLTSAAPTPKGVCGPGSGIRSRTHHRVCRYCLHRSTAHILSESRPLWTIIIDNEMASFLLWFAAIQGIERKQDLAGLAPKLLYNGSDGRARSWAIRARCKKQRASSTCTIDSESDRVPFGTRNGFCCAGVPGYNYIIGIRWCLACRLLPDIKQRNFRSVGPSCNKGAVVRGYLVLLTWLQGRNS